MPNNDLVVIRGLPGSGKSTKARNDFPHHLHYEPDHLFCDTRGLYCHEHQLWGAACDFVLKMTDVALARGENVVVSDVFPKLASLRPYREVAAAHGASFRCITCDDSFGSVHSIPVFVLKKMRNEFECGEC